MTDEIKCPVCGGRHLLLETHGITHSVCKQVPVGFVWLDQKFKTGPKGTLFPLKDNVREDKAA